MFSGKTEELLRRIRRAHIAKLPVALFKPATDTRYDNVEVVSHDKNSMTSMVVPNSKAVYDHIQHAEQREPGREERYSIVAIDEAQFFDGDLPKVCNDLANQGYRVIVAGLDLDYEEAVWSNASSFGNGRRSDQTPCRVCGNGQSCALFTPDCRRHEPG